MRETPLWNGPPQGKGRRGAGPGNINAFSLPAGTREISAPDRAPRGHASTWGQRCVSLLTVYFSLGFVIVFVFG